MMVRLLVLPKFRLLWQSSYVIPSTVTLNFRNTSCVRCGATHHNRLEDGFVVLDSDCDKGLFTWAAPLNSRQIGSPVLSRFVWNWKYISLTAYFKLARTPATNEKPDPHAADQSEASNQPALAPHPGSILLVEINYPCSNLVKWSPLLKSDRPLEAAQYNK